MTEGDNNGATPPTGPPIWLSATLDDFAGTDFEAPIRNCDSADCYDLHTLFSKAAEEAKTAGQLAAERVFAMLAAVCSFHFKPEEPNEPFGPMFSSADRRSSIVDDFRGKASETLESVAPEISSLVLAARIADTCWLIERSRVACASIAINNYVGIVNSIESGKLRYRFSSDGGALDLHSVQYLRRALQIGYAIGSDKPETKSAQDTVGRLRQRAVAERLAFAIQLFASLDLDFQISTAEEIAREIERIIPKPSDPSSFFLIHALWRLAARAYHQAKLGDEEARCIISAAECLAQQAKANCALGRNKARNGGLKPGRNRQARNYGRAFCNRV